MNYEKFLYTTLFSMLLNNLCTGQTPTIINKTKDSIQHTKSTSQIVRSGSVPSPTTTDILAPISTEEMARRMKEKNKKNGNRK